MLHEAYRLYCKDFIEEHQISPISIWGFVNILSDETKTSYMNRAKVSLREKKIMEIRKKLVSL